MVEEELEEELEDELEEEELGEVDVEDSPFDRVLFRLLRPSPGIAVCCAWANCSKDSASLVLGLGKNGYWSVIASAKCKWLYKKARLDGSTHKLSTGTST